MDVDHLKLFEDVDEGRTHNAIQIRIMARSKEVCPQILKLVVFLQ